MNLRRFETLLFRMGGTLCDWAYRLQVRRERHLPRCPDCGIAPDTGGECPVCLDNHYSKRADDAIYQQGYDDAYDRMDRESA